MEINRNQKIILRVLAIVLVPGLIWLGFLREETFIEMNKLIMFKENPEVGNYAGEIVESYYDYSAPELYTAKWYLTVKFTLLFLAYSSIILFLYFLEFKPIKYLIFFYIGLFALSAISYGSGFITGNSGGAYLVARRLMGLLQSPYPFMLIFVLILFGLDKLQLAQKNDA